ncbi:MAG TPA: multidrug efflux MFS transporter [Candidatus Anaerostipes avicola]|nr:multidrug efflux MFS transporter [Candidatus Anaerostipes avicola]
MRGEKIMTNRQKMLIFINIMITCIASSMLATALTTALPPIMEDFGLTIATGQWLTSGYSLAMGIMMPLTAFLITRFPTKRLYVTAIGLFIAGLLICVLAPSFPVMMVGRILQASGNGILTSMAQVILLTVFPEDKRGTIMGWYGLSVGAAPVIAPTLAGVLVDSFGWQMIFYIDAAIMAVSFVFALIVFRDVLETKKQKFDVSSFVMSAVAFGGVTLGIGNLSGQGITNMANWVILAVGVIVFVVFVRRQIHLKEPFLEMRIVKDYKFALSLAGSMLLYLVMMGSSIIMPLYVQTVMGYSATVSGLVTLPGSLAMAVVSPFAGKIYDKLGMKKLFVAGAVCMLLSNIGMFLITMETSIWIAAFYNVIRCISIGCLMMPLVTWGVSGFDSYKTAHGTALLTSLRTIAGAVGSAVFSGIMTAVGAASAASYGSGAQMHGLNTAFLAMSFATAVLLLIAVFLVKEKKEPWR